jgi:outer membrane protein OmpA-like peptidoglycan-associated protein
MGGPLVGYDAQRDAPALFKQKNKYFGVHLDYLLDVTNLWGRYNEKKVFRLIPWLGLGYAQRFENQGYSRTETPTVNAGILTAFRLSKRVDLNVEVQGALTNEDFNRIYEYHLCDFIAQASVGLTFKLGRTDFEVCEPTDYGLLNNLNDQINKLRAENEELSKRPESCPVCQQVQPAAKPAQNYGKNVVFFRLNSARIDKDQEINVYNTAQFVKEHNVPVTVIGYADKKTGSSKYNMALSEKRAKAVAKQLMDKYGIPSNQISIEYHGSDEQPYHINNWNRVVIMTAEQGQE